MSRFTLLAAFVLTFGIAHAHAQTLPATGPAEAAARPGHVPGVGDSLPLSGTASNIGPGDTRSAIAPTLPQPAVGADASMRAYLQAARDDLAVTGGTGRTGAAQQALEMAETRALDRVIPPDQQSGPSHSTLVSQISDARTALGQGDIAGAIRLIDGVLAR